jgi:hypothetical protein
MIVFEDNKRCGYEIEVANSEDFEFPLPKEEGWY